MPKSHGRLFTGPFLALIAPLALAACAAEPVTVTQRIYVKQEVPSGLLACAAWPAPARPPTDLRGLVEWLARAKAAHLDCSWKLGKVGELVAPAP